MLVMACIDLHYAGSSLLQEIFDNNKMTCAGFSLEWAIQKVEFAYGSLDLALAVLAWTSRTWYRPLPNVTVSAYMNFVKIIPVFLHNPANKQTNLVKT